MKAITSFTFVLLFLGAQALAQGGADKMIVPGERIGPASLDMSLDVLLQALGPRQAVGRPNNGQIVLQQGETAEARAAAVHRFDHLGLRAVTPAGNESIGQIATYNSADTDHGYSTKEGIKIGSTRSEVEAAYGTPTATTVPNPLQKQMIYDTRGVGLRLTPDHKVDLIQVFRPGAARERWKF